MIKLIQGDCNKIMRIIRRNTIDTIITDPPYSLKFMGKAWDYKLPSVRCFKRMLRVAKPGAVLLCFGGTRTFHRLACNIEDAGWTIKDCIMWLYGSGFPKSHNISKAIDKAKGKKRKITGRDKSFGAHNSGIYEWNKRGTIPKNEWNKHDIPISSLALLWNGYGTGLKPAFEPIIVAMKPLDGTYAQNAEKYGVAGLNIDGGRIEMQQKDFEEYKEKRKAFDGCVGKTVYKGSALQRSKTKHINKIETKGRWPANIILDKKTAKMLDKQTGTLPGPWGKKKSKTKHGNAIFNPGESKFDNADWQSTGQGASRFFYCAKASKKERNLGLQNLKAKQRDLTRKKGKPGGDNPRNRGTKEMLNCHPTVKPLALMEYLCTLTMTPTGGIVLDPFTGTGTTGMACKLTARHFIGIELDKDYCRIAKLRMKATKRKKPRHAISKKTIFKV